MHCAAGLGRVLGEVCVVLASERVLGLVWVMLGSDGARKGVFIVSERVPMNCLKAAS